MALLSGPASAPGSDTLTIVISPNSPSCSTRIRSCFIISSMARKLTTISSREAQARSRSRKTILERSASSRSTKAILSATETRTGGTTSLTAGFSSHSRST